jgi:hypothetical protein
MLVGFAALAVILLLMLAYRWVYWRSQRNHRTHVAREGGAFVLRLPPGHNLLLGVLALAPGGVLAAMALTAKWSQGAESNGPILAIAAGVPAIAAAGFLFAMESRARIRVDDRGLERVGILRRRRVGWGEVARIVFNPLNNWFLVQGPGSRMWIPVGLDGISDFATLALARLPPEVLAASPEAKEELAELAAAP